MNDDNHKRHVNLHQDFLDSIKQDVAKKKAKKQADKLQKRKDMFLAAILTGVISSGKFNPISNNDMNYAINSAITAANNLFDTLGMDEV